MNENMKAGAEIHAGEGGESEGTKEGYEAFVKERNKSLAEGRIREIAEQCNIGKLVDTWEYEKFAELIIMECLSICENLGDKGMDGHYCADEIGRTFGVK